METTDLRDRLAEVFKSLSTFVSKLEISSKDRFITIEGTTTSYYNKQLATKVVKDAGFSLANNIVVAKPVGIIT